MGRDGEAQRLASTASLYEQDFYSWTQQQALLLRAGRLQALDVTNILEEIETLGRSERASLKSAYRLICSHLLKMKYQASKLTRSWSNTVDRERGEVAEILHENPGLRSSREDAFAKAYALARRDAARETRMPVEIFPEKPPFTLAECESVTFLPEELRGLVGPEKRSVAKTGKAKDA